MTTLAERARAASFPTQIRSPAYEEKLKDEEARKADEAAAAAQGGDPGVAGSGARPPTAGQVELQKQAEHDTAAPEKFSPVQLRSDQAEQGVTNYAQPTGGQLVGMTPGGWSPAQRSREQSVTGPRFSPETSGLLNQAALMEAGARRNLAAVEGGQNLALQGIEERRAQQEAIYAEGRAKRDEFHQKVVKARRDKIAAMEADVADDKVDPRRLFKNMGAGELALFGLGGVLASLGAGFSAAAGQHGPSPFIEQMRINVQQDIAAQERDISKKEKGIGRAVNALDALQQTFGDRETALLALESLQLKAYENATKKLMLKYDNTALAPKLQLANAQIVRMLGENRMKMEAMSQYKVEAQQADKFGQPMPIYAGGAPGGKPPKLNEALNSGMVGIRDYLDKTKAAGKEAIMRRFVDALPERQRGAFLNYIRDGNMGRALDLFKESAFDGDAGKQSAFMDATDLLIRERTGAVAPPEEVEGYKKMLGQNADAKRLMNVVRHMQMDLDNIWNGVRVSQPDFAAEWEIRNDYFRGVPQRALGGYPSSAARK